RGGFSGHPRRDRGARAARPRHHRARGFSAEARDAKGSWLMKALFLGGVAADTYAGIEDELPAELESVVIGEPIDRARLPDAAIDADILVSNHGRPDYPAAPKIRLVQSVATGTELFELAALPRGCAVCNSFGHETAIAEY